MLKCRCAEFSAAQIGFSNSCIRVPMSTFPACPKCQSEYTYEDGDNYVCPECAHEWPKQAAEAAGETARVYKDAVGAILQDGDTVTVIKDLKPKGSGGVIKQGTK